MENSLLVSVHELLIALMGILWCNRKYFHKVLLYFFLVSIQSYRIAACTKGVLFNILLMASYDRSRIHVEHRVLRHMVLGRAVHSLKWALIRGDRLLFCREHNQGL